MYEHPLDFRTTGIVYLMADDTPLIVSRGGSQLPSFSVGLVAAHIFLTLFRSRLPNNARSTIGTSTALVPFLSRLKF